MERDLAGFFGLSRLGGLFVDGPDLAARGATEVIRRVHLAGVDHPGTGFSTAGTSGDRSGLFAGAHGDPSHLSVRAQPAGEGRSGK